MISEGVRRVTRGLKVVSREFKKKYGRDRTISRCSGELSMGMYKKNFRKGFKGCPDCFYGGFGQASRRAHGRLLMGFKVFM